MNNAWILPAIWVLLGLAHSGCKKAEPEQVPVLDAAPSATVIAPVPTPTASPEPSASEAPKTPPPKATNVGADISGCCSALKAEAKKASAVDKNTYQSAAAVCDGLAARAKSGTINPVEAKRTVRAQLQRARIPAACN